MAKNQIKSKERVSEHGEVFTNEREVNAMLDLVKDESYNIESTFLEPACGDGNFLEVILKRKLFTVDQKYGKTPSDYEKYSIIALSSIYGVELLEDNCSACIERLFKIYDEEYTRHLKKSASDEIREAAKYILKKNILCGDALTLLKNDGAPIIFAEWKFVIGSKLKRRDFTLEKLLKTQDASISIFDYQEGMDWDKETQSFIPSPIKEFPPVDIKEITKYE